MATGEVSGKPNELLGITLGGSHNFWVLAYDVYFLRMGSKALLAEACYLEKYSSR